MAHGFEDINNGHVGMDHGESMRNKIQVYPRYGFSTMQNTLSVGRQVLKFKKKRIDKKYRFKKEYLLWVEKPVSNVILQVGV